MSRENRIGEVRTVATFDSYQPQTSEQEVAHRGLMQVAQQLIINQDHVATERHPFNFSRWIMLWGQPGTGKTHLLEAFSNKLRSEAPKVIPKAYLARSNFTHDNMSFGADYDNKPIVLIDDMFATKHSVDELHPRTDIAAIVNFVRETYEQRRLVISTCNFPFKGVILDKVKQVDQTGRIVSRLEEILASSGELEITGPDYRKILGNQRDTDPFKIF